MLRVFGRHLRALALIVAVLTLAVVATIPQPAAADAVSDKQAQADRLAAALWERSEALTLGSGTGDPVVAD